MLAFLVNASIFCQCLHSCSRPELSFLISCVDALSCCVHFLSLVVYTLYLLLCTLSLLLCTLRPKEEYTLSHAVLHVPWESPWKILWALQKSSADIFDELFLVCSCDSFHISFISINKFHIRWAVQLQLYCTQWLYQSKWENAFFVALISPRNLTSRKIVKV